MESEHLIKDIIFRDRIGFKHDANLAELESLTQWLKKEVKKRTG